MKYLIVLSVLFLLACERTETKNITSKYEMPAELNGCKIFYLSSEKSRNLWVTVCGKSIGTQWEDSESCGKNCSKHTPHSSTTTDMRQ